MFCLIEALNFRCLRYVSQPLTPLHVLVGPNASGKTTFLDVLAFLGRLASDGLEAAIDERTRNFVDLVTRREGTHFELAVEAAIPAERRQQLAKQFDVIRYEVRIGLDSATQEVGILEEKAWLTKHATQQHRQKSLPFPCEPVPPNSLLAGKAKSGWQSVLTKAPGGNDNFYVEVRPEGGGKGWFPSIRLGPRKSALGNIPEDESKFPVATWFKELLTRGVQSFMLNSLVVAPELDIWVWSDSPHVADELGWKHRQPGLRDWLIEQGWLSHAIPKPARPKEALEAALRLVRKPRSSAIYKALAEKVSLNRCHDEAFLKLKTTLRDWFNKE